MSPEAYALHRERTLYLSEHPLVDRSPDGLEETRQITLMEAFAA